MAATTTPRLVARATMRGLECPEHTQLLNLGHQFHYCPAGHRVERGTLDTERRQP